MGSPSSASALIEPSVAFFGAADNRPSLFFLTVTLQSVRRFHRKSAYFALLPEAEAAGSSRWSVLLRAWSSGGVKALALPNVTWHHDFIAPRGSLYSSMTFHRHRVPQMLLALGYKFSVNLDPDVLCVRPWDLSILLQIRFIGGRPVGSGARTAAWLHERAASAQPSGGPTARGANLTEWLRSTLNMTKEELRHSREFNGGVLAFNNTAAMELQWAATLTRHFEQLKTIVEGDQDLVGLVLAANPTFPRHELPSTYNYAFRRDRERLPYHIAHRLRHGLFGQQVVNVHFVADGKPWQQQNLTLYPMWLLAARLHHVNEWLSISRTMKPRLPNLHLKPPEREMVGRVGLEVLRASALRNASLATMTDVTTRQRCRCFIRSLVHDKKADPLVLLRKAGMEEMPQPSFTAASMRTNLAHKRTVTLAQAGANVNAHRGHLLWVCGGGRGSRPTPEEEDACDDELGEAREKFLCALVAHGRSGNPRYSLQTANCSVTRIDGYEAKESKEAKELKEAREAKEARRQRKEAKIKLHKPTLERITQRNPADRVVQKAEKTRPVTTRRSTLPGALSGRLGASANPISKAKAKAKAKTAAGHKHRIAPKHIR